MTNEQICQYIKHYIEKDKTKSALMLTAPWGKGKSYFVQNELISYLEENGNYQSVVVSLYGVDSLEEISKSIYFEIKGFAIKKKIKKAIEKVEIPTNDGIKKILPEFIPAAKIAGATVIKGITSFVGVDLSLGNLEELYTSVDLSEKLLVFEDIERSRIDITEFLGYVNSIVEQDGVKVLLISNEEELIHYVSKEVEEDGKKKQVKICTENSLRYLQFKEKTVSDTLQFYGNTRNAIKNIIGQYNSKHFDRFMSDSSLDYIENLLLAGRIDNLRIFIFACQKTFEIYEEIDEYNLKDEYLECIFYGIVLFSKSIKTGIFPPWDGTEYLSSKLTGGIIPLFRFCYEYIRWHEFDKSAIASTINAYDEYRMVNQRYDADLAVVFDYCVSTEANILEALSRIDDRLNTPLDIPFGLYGKLAYHLVKLYFLLNYDFSSIQQKMLNNLKSNGQSVSIQGLMMNYFEFETNAEEELFEDFRKSIEATIRISQQDTEYFSYKPADIAELQKRADNVSQYTHRFISLYNLEKMVDMLFQCDAKELQAFRSVMFSVYRNAYSGQFEVDDSRFMEHMIALITCKKESVPHNFDRIQLLQLNYLCENLKMFISQLS